MHPIHHTHVTPHAYHERTSHTHHAYITSHTHHTHITHTSHHTHITHTKCTSHTQCHNLMISVKSRHPKPHRSRRSKIKTNKSKGKRGSRAVSALRRKLALNPHALLPGARPSFIKRHHSASSDDNKEDTQSQSPTSGLF